MTVKNRYPIPTIEDIMQYLQGATIFLLIDIQSGYHQVRMNPKEIFKTLDHNKDYSSL